MEISTIEILKSCGEIATAIVAISLLFVPLYRALNRKPRLRQYYVAHGIFIDRVSCLNQLVNCLNIDRKIINVYGKRGMGKSSFLKYFCDHINQNLNSENCVNKIKKSKIKKLFNFRNRAIYVELSGYSDQTIECQISKAIIGEENMSLEALCDKLIKELPFTRRIIIALDNINNGGIARDIEHVIDIFLSSSSKFRIIIGSVEKHPFLNALNEQKIDFVSLKSFDRDNILEFARMNSKKVMYDPAYLSQVFEFSEGLPVFVSLLLSEPSGITSLRIGGSMRIKEYIKRMIDELDNESKELIQYISLLSITNAVIPLKLLCHFVLNLNIRNLDKLELYSFIEYDIFSQTVKMHELIRNHINIIFEGHNNEKSYSIYKYYESCDQLLNQIYYLLLMKEVKGYDLKIIESIKKGVIQENYSFLILLGEHFKMFHEFNIPGKNLSGQAFLYIIWGYIEGHIGVGNYPAAREIIDNCKIPSRFVESEIQFCISLSTAQLYHLQNDYQTAISTYSILLSSAELGTKFESYRAACLWGIAHSYRHEGKNPDIALDYYDQAIDAAIKTSSFEILIKSKIEKLTLLNCRSKYSESNELLEEIKNDIKNLPINEFLGLKISQRKAEARHMRISSNTSTREEKIILKEVLRDYKKLKKRLQYNTFFELGEHYRKGGKYKQAVANYRKSLLFSLKNLDQNLNTMSHLGIILCEMLSQSPFRSASDPNPELLLQNIISKCERYNLHTNRLLAEMIYDFIRGNPVDQSIIDTFQSMGYQKEMDICYSSNPMYLKNLDLVLM
ncbi:tetratricopeptide repeat protein [Akkermansia sp. AKK6]